MAKKRTFKIIFGAVVGILILACAGFFHFVRPFWKPPFPPTRQGLFFEELIPQNVDTVFSFNPGDEDEQKRFAQLLEIIARGKSDFFIPALVGNLIKHDLTVLLNANSKFLLAFETEDPGNIFAAHPFYFLAETSNAEFSRGDYVKTLAAPQTIESTDDTLLVKTGDLYYGVVGDVVFFTEADEQKAKHILYRYKYNFAQKFFEKSLSRLRVFQNAINSISFPSSGYSFGDNGANPPKDLKGNFNIINFQAETDGVRIETLSRAGKEQKVFLKSYGPFSLNLYKKVHTNDLMAFATSRYNIGLAQSTPLANFLPKAADSLKMNYIGEIEPLFDEEFVLSIRNGTSVLAYISLLVDARKMPDSASRLVKALDSNMPTWLSLINMSLKSETDPVAQSAGFSQWQDGRILKFYLNRIPTDIANIPLFQGFQSPLEISYGMTDEGILFVSTAPNFENALSSGSSSVENDRLMQKALSFNQNPSSVYLVNVKDLIKFADSVIEFAKRQNRLNPKEEAVYLTAKKYLESIESFVYSENANGKEIRGTGFLSIKAADAAN